MRLWACIGSSGRRGIASCPWWAAAHTDPDLVAGSDIWSRRLATVKRMLLSGMSATGKSSVIEALTARGYKAFDTDDGWCEPLPDGRQRWREDAIEKLLAVEDAEVLFVAVCEENQVRSHPRFDVIILLSAPAEVLAGRLASRTGNPYGKTPGELRRVFDDLWAVEPLLCKAADYEIRITMPLSDVVTAVLRLTGARR
jgi:hypothetical protein